MRKLWIVIILSLLTLVAPEPRLSPPLGAGIFSWAAKAGLSPMEPYLQWTMHLALLIAVAGLAAVWRGELLSTISNLFAQTRARPVAFDGASASVTALCVLVCFTISQTFVEPGTAFSLFFHEGEWLGLIPTLSHFSNPLEHVFLIHGFGVDLLPAAIADWLAPDGYRIAAARDVRVVIGLSFPVALWLLLRELALSSGVRRVGAVVLLSSCLLVATEHVAWVLASDPVVDLPLRRIVLLFQVATVLRILRSRNLLLAGLLGMSLPVAFLWNMGDAAMAALVVVSALCVSALCNPRRATVNGAACICGSVGFYTCLSAAAPELPSVVIEMVRYWAANGRDIFLVQKLPGPLSSLYFTLSLCVQAVAIVRLAVSIHGIGLRETARTSGVIGVMLVLALVYMRVPLELGMDHYYGVAGLFQILLALCLGMEARRWIVASAGKGVPLGIAVSLALGPLVLTRADPLSIPTKLMDLRWATSVPDASLMRADTALAVRYARSSLAGQDCTYVMGSSASWYYLAGVRSCSRYHQAIYASSPAAQRQVVLDLEAEKPERIIHDVPYDDLKGGVTNMERLPILEEYVKAHYIPESESLGLSIWRRAYPAQ